MYIVLNDGYSDSRQHILKDENGKLEKFLRFLADTHCLDSSVDWIGIESLNELIEDWED